MELPTQLHSTTTTKEPKIQIYVLTPHVLIAITTFPQVLNLLDRCFAITVHAMCSKKQQTRGAQRKKRDKKLL